MSDCNLYFNRQQCSQLSCDRICPFYTSRLESGASAGLWAGDLQALPDVKRVDSLDDPTEQCGRSRQTTLNENLINC